MLKFNQSNTSSYELSSIFSSFYKYTFPYLLIAIFAIGFYLALKYDETILILFFGAGCVYLPLVTFLVINRISVHVILDKDSRTIIAYNSSNGKQKVGQWSDLVNVYEFLTFYSVLQFRNGMKIRFRPKKYVFLFEEEDAEDIMDLLEQISLKNKEE